MSWKSVVYEYVDKRNRMEMDYTIKPILPYVWDEEYLYKLSRHLQRRSLVHRERRLTPIQNESRVKLTCIGEEEGVIIADIELRHHFEYEIHDQRQTEARIDRERLLLKEIRGQWVISKVEFPLTHRDDAVVNLTREQERMHTASPYEEKIGWWQDRHGILQSQPYLNRAVLHGDGFTQRVVPYQRLAAVQYADRWWDSENPEFLAFDVDCTNYVSQCIFAGGAPMNYTGKRNAGWWYRGRSGKQELWSYSWAVSNSLYRHMVSSKTGLRAEVVPSAGDLQLGDVICYDWDGTGRYQHTTVVTAFSKDGSPLVNAHTVNSKHRFWDYRDSYAWTERTVYRFLHIPDWL
ncbi:amidase domain-containing protein [Paenibacillus senegalensis]|uniref:amidase domain-containing protein n=1 Tax=Paenibacillus senegalensis TaxID=1465766 RepID=UPI000287AE69|nr:amidase domain-containing protein [Paenibacillus senegalensis]